jgi:hypothetical protein
MRSLSALLACVFLFAASAATADSRVFIIANQADGYGVDQCLAKGEKCGAHAARSYCQSRFPQAVTATMPAATNTLRLPASAEPLLLALPHRRPGNDVTLPLEAAKGSRVGRAFGFSACTE